MDFRELLRHILLASIPAFQVLWDTGVVLDWTQTLTSSIIPTLSGQASAPLLPAITDEFPLDKRDVMHDSRLEEPPLSRLLFPPAPQLVCVSAEHHPYAEQIFPRHGQESAAPAEMVTVLGVADHPLLAALSEVSGSFVPKTLLSPSASSLYLLLLAIATSLALWLLAPLPSKSRRRVSVSALPCPIGDELYGDIFGILAVGPRPTFTAHQSVRGDVDTPGTIGGSPEVQDRTPPRILQRVVSPYAPLRNSIRPSPVDISSSSEGAIHIAPEDIVEEFFNSSPGPLAGDHSTESAEDMGIFDDLSSRALADVHDGLKTSTVVMAANPSIVSSSDYAELRSPYIFKDVSAIETFAQGREDSTDLATSYTPSPSAGCSASEQNLEVPSKDIITVLSNEPKNAAFTIDPVPERSITSVPPEATTATGTFIAAVVPTTNTIELPSDASDLRSPDYMPAASFPFMTQHEGLDWFLDEPMDSWDWTLVNVRLHEQGSFVRDYRPRASPETPLRFLDRPRSFINRPNAYTHTTQPSFSHEPNSSDRRRTRSDNEHIYRRDIWLATRADVDPEPLLSPLSISRFRSLSSRVGLLLPSRSLRLPRPLEELDLAVPEEKDLLKYYRKLRKTIKSRGKTPPHHWIPYGMRSRDFVKPCEQEFEVSYAARASSGVEPSSKAVVSCASVSDAPTPIEPPTFVEVNRSRGGSAISVNRVVTRAQAPPRPPSRDRSQDRNVSRGPSPSPTPPSTSASSLRPPLRTGSRARASSFQANSASAVPFAKPFGRHARGVSDGSAIQSGQIPSAPSKGAVSGIVINADREQPSWAPTRFTTPSPNAWSQSSKIHSRASSCSNWRSRDPSPDLDSSWRPSSIRYPVTPLSYRTETQPVAGPSSSPQPSSITQASSTSQPRRGRASLGPPLLPTPPATSPAATDYTTTHGQFQSRTSDCAPLYARVDDDDALSRYIREQAQTGALPQGV